jgi:hypothetical protein
MKTKPAVRRVSFFGRTSVLPSNLKTPILDHHNDLVRNWEHAQRFEPMERIPGADHDD